MRRRFGSWREALGLWLRRPRRRATFWVVTAAHDAAPYVERCLESVATQRYPREHVRHLVIDDASADTTAELVRAFSRRHPERAVELRENAERRGGCANLTAGFRAAPAGSIVVQLDGDDFLPDRQVLAYLDVLYGDPELWMTYNTWAGVDGEPGSHCREIPAEVVADNAYRDHPWTSSHLHSFRKELFDHVREERLIDPETGDYFRSSVDMSHYFPMLELAGRHARHVARVTYAYNLHEGSIINADRAAQLACEARIRALPRCTPLLRLEGPGSGQIAGRG